MTQPSYVPIIESDQVRPAYRLRTPGDWRQSRVAELISPDAPRGKAIGTPGPDTGYAQLLAHELFAERVELTDGIGLEDALAAGAIVAGRRAALFGRAPVAKDVELGLTVFGLLGGAPDDLVEWRTPRLQALSHHYQEQRRLADAVPESTLRLDPSQAAGRLGDWRALLDATA
jgi:hypothetical protein